MNEADRLCDRIAIIDHGRIIGLDTPRALRRLLPSEHGFEVTIDANGTDPARAFAGLARIRHDFTAAHPAADWLSAGMSGDLEQAVRAGATHVRVGSAILGSRPRVK